MVSGAINNLLVFMFCFVLVFKSIAVQTLFLFVCLFFSAYVLRLVYPCSDSVEPGGSHIFRFNIFYMS